MENFDPTSFCLCLYVSMVNRCMMIEGPIGQLSPIGTNARSYSKLKITPFNGYILIVIGRLFEQRKAVIENSENGAVTEKSLAAKLDVFDTEYINR